MRSEVPSRDIVTCFAAAECLYQRLITFPPVGWEFPQLFSKNNLGGEVLSDLGKLLQFSGSTPCVQLVRVPKSAMVRLTVLSECIEVVPSKGPREITEFAHELGLIIAQYRQKFGCAVVYSSSAEPVKFDFSRLWEELFSLYDLLLENFDQGVCFRDAEIVSLLFEEGSYRLLRVRPRGDDVYALGTYLIFKSIRSRLQIGQVGGELEVDILERLETFLGLADAA